MACGTQRVTADEAPGGKPDPSQRAVSIDGFRRIVRARGQEPARASKVWRNKDLVGAKRQQAQADARTPFSGPDGGVFR